MGAQRTLQQFQLRYQLVGGQVVVARYVARVLGDAPARVLQPAAHEGQLEPVAFAGVAAPRLLVGGRQRRGVASQAVGKFLRYAVDLLGAAELRGQLVDRAQQLGERAVVLQLQHGGSHLGGHERVAVAVAADPAPEVQRAGMGGKLDADPRELRVHLVEQVAADVAQQLLQVVDRRPRLVGGSRTVDAQFVGLPDQVDRLGEPPPDAFLIHRGLTRIRLLVEQFADAPQLGEHGTARRLGGVGGKHRPHVESRGHFAQGGALRVVGLDMVEQGAQAAAGDAAARSVLVHAMGLFGHVGQVKEGGEGAHQVGGVGDVEPGQQGVELGGGAVIGAGVARLLAQRAHALDQLQQMRAVLPHQGVAEQVAEQPDVGPHRRVPRLAKPAAVSCPSHRAAIVHCFAGVGVRMSPSPPLTPARRRREPFRCRLRRRSRDPRRQRFAPSGWRADHTHRAPSRRRVRPKRAGSAAAQTRCRRSAARPGGRRALGPPSQRRALTGYAGGMPVEERPDFVHPVVVRLHHTDAAGVIFCSRLLELAHEAYEALLDEAGLSVGRILADGALRLPVVALEAEFNRPIRVGERLQVELTVSRRGDHSYQVAYRFRDPAGQVKARAVTRHVALDGAGAGPVALPEPLARLADGAAGP